MQERLNSSTKLLSTGRVSRNNTPRGQNEKIILQYIHKEVQGKGD